MSNIRIRKEYSPVVDRATRILKILNASPEPMSIADITRSMQEYRETVERAIAYLRKPSNKQMYVADHRPQHANGTGMKIALFLAGDLPDKEPPPKQTREEKIEKQRARVRVNNAVHNQRRAEQRMIDAAAKSAPFIPKADPFVATFFGLHR